VKHKMYIRNLKIFHKIFMIYMIIIIVAVLALAQIINESIVSESLKRDVRYNKLVLVSLDVFLTQKQRAVLEVVEKMHNGTDLENRPSSFLELPDTQDTDYYVARNRFISYLESAFSVDTDLSGLTVYKQLEDKLYLVSRVLKSQIPSESYKHPYMLEQIDDFSTRIVTYPAQASYYHEKGYHYTLEMNIKSINNFENTGTLIADFRVDGIMNSIVRHYDEIKGNILVLTNDGSVVFDSLNRYYGQTYPHTDLLRLGTSKSKIDGLESIINVERSTELGLTLVGIIPKVEVLQSINQMKWLIYGVSMLCILTILFLSLAMTRLFSRRIRAILTVFKKVRKGDLTARISLSNSKDELYEISDNFNIMCDELETYIQKVFVSELRQKQAELMALQSQINPHFLYNTLEAIRMKAISSGAREASEMILILSKLFRIAVREDAITDIGSELENAMLYLKLFEIRYESRLTTTFDIEEGILDYGIIRNTLQPVLENYIMYGFDGSKEMNQIRVEAHRNGEYIDIEVIDNGSGIEATKLIKLRKRLNSSGIMDKSSIGLGNVNERIRLIMGHPCGIEIESEMGIGTTVRVKITANKVEELRNHV
jgi:two-component system sensor histidine kinase YesM